MITCDESLETKNIMIKTVPAKSNPTNFNESKKICKMKNFYILLAFLLITVTLLIAVSIYFFIKYWEKQKHLLPASSWYQYWI